MNSFNLFSEPFTNALGWALVHTLWQGTVFAAVAALALRLSQSRSSSVRYGIGIGTLALQLVTFLATFWICYEPVRATLLISGEHQTSLVMTSSASGNWIGELTTWLNHHFPLLVMVWFCGTALLMVRLVGGWIFVQRLTRKNVSPVAEVWQTCLNQLGKQLGITKSVRLIESAEIAVPMTIGWLKPLVLVPIGLLAGLSPRQVEAVLAHELAHIRRYDYLVNLIQSAVEILLFFHPAIWWLSARVREEREHCCDDVAIQLCGERASLAQALVHIEERRQAVLVTPALAMAFGARKQSFVQRVKRVIGVSEQQSSSKPNGLLVAGCLVLLTGLVTGQHLYRPAKSSRRHSDSITINAWKSAVDTVIGREEPQEINLTLLEKVEPQFEFSKTDTIDPFTRIRLEKEFEYHAEEMKRLEREMSKISPLIENEQLLELKSKALELAALEQENVREQMQKIQALTEGSMRHLNDSLGVFAAKAAKLADLHAVEVLRLQEKLQDLDTLRAKVLELHAVPDIPAFEAEPIPVPAIAPVPNRAPRPARMPKPAKVKGAYWYNGKSYNSPAEMPKAAQAAYPPPPPAVATFPPVPAIAPVPPALVLEPAVAPEPVEGVWIRDGKRTDKARYKLKGITVSPKPAQTITTPKAEN